jgi:hypothetical protein
MLLLINRKKRRFAILIVLVLSKAENIAKISRYRAYQKQGIRGPTNRFHGSAARLTALTASSSFDRNRERSFGVMDGGPPVTVPSWRRSAVNSRIARAATISLFEGLSAQIDDAGFLRQAPGRWFAIFFRRLSTFVVSF